MRSLVAAAFVLIAFAGCADRPEAAPDGDLAPGSQREEPAADPGPPDGSRKVTTMEADGALLYETTSWRDTIDLTLPYGVPFAPYDQQDPRRFEVGDNVTAALIEVVWDDMTSDLDAYAIPDRCPDIGPQVDVECEVGVTTRTTHWYDADGGSPGAGDSPSRLMLADQVLQTECPSSCDWTFGAHARTLAARVVVDLYVTLFYGDVPDGFTAVPAA